MELKDTVEEMLSDDYIQRFKAEYNQTKIRYNKLQKMVVKYEAGTLGFEPKCPIEVLKDQKMYMGCYLFKMEVRAEIEGIELWFEEFKKSADGYYDPICCEGQSKCIREGYVYYKTTDSTFSFKNVSREYLGKK